MDVAASVTGDNLFFIGLSHLNSILNGSERIKNGTIPVL
jgi:hypothetical protein